MKARMHCVLSNEEFVGPWEDTTEEELPRLEQNLGDALLNKVVHFRDADGAIIVAPSLQVLYLYVEVQS